METFENLAAQGDLLIRRVDRLPDNVTKKPVTKEGHHIVAHSETGHHHVVDGSHVDYYTSDDTMVAYIEVHEPTPIQHLREFDTHAPINIPAGIFELRRQREYTPEGWRQIQD